jgi:plastocyanin
MLMMETGYYADARRSRYRARAAVIAALLALAAPSAVAIAQGTGAPAAAVKQDVKNFYLPTGAAAKVLTVTEEGEATNEITVMAERVAVKETGPKETIAKFGEVYDFSPSFIAAYRDAPIRLTFWNLQPDDEHDFMLADPRGNVLMHAKLPPLSKLSWVFTFHDAGLYNFYCAVHQPEMNGQLLVLAPEKK